MAGKPEGLVRMQRSDRLAGYLPTSLLAQGAALVNAEGAIALLAADGSIDGRGASSPSGRSVPSVPSSPRVVAAPFGRVCDT